MNERTTQVKYYWDNRAKVLAYKKEYYAKNRELCQERTRSYQQSEQGKHKRAEREWREMSA